MINHYLNTSLAPDNLTTWPPTKYDQCPTQYQCASGHRPLQKRAGAQQQTQPYHDFKISVHAPAAADCTARVAAPSAAVNSIRPVPAHASTINLTRWHFPSRQLHHSPPRTSSQGCTRYPLRRTTQLRAAAPSQGRTLDWCRLPHRHRQQRGHQRSPPSPHHEPRPLCVLAGAPFWAESVAASRLRLRAY